MTSAILATRGLTKRFDAVSAAADISVEIMEHSWVGLIGANGAGKTSFINMVTGYLKPTCGQIHYAGQEITALPPRRITQLGVSRSFQVPQLFNTLSVRDNLVVAAGIVAAGARRWAHDAIAPSRVGTATDEILERCGLAEYRDRPAGLLPEGIRKLLDIAMALVVRPRILLLDEPTSGVAAEEKFGIMDVVMTAVGAERVTVLFVEHDMDIVSRYAERVLAFYEGRIIADGEPASTLNDPEVRKYVTGEDVHAAH